MLLQTVCAFVPADDDKVTVAAFTVTVAVILQPRSFVYVIMVVPAETPVTTPLEFTVAILVLEDNQGFDGAAVPEPVKVVVLLLHTLNVPVMVGKDFMVTVALLLQPVLSV